MRFDARQLALLLIVLVCTRSSLCQGAQSKGKESDKSSAMPRLFFLAVTKLSITHGILSALVHMDYCGA